MGLHVVRYIRAGSDIEEEGFGDRHCRMKDSKLTRVFGDPEFTVSFAICSGSDRESTCPAGDPGSIPGLGRSAGEGNGNPLQYSCLGNATDAEALQATVHGVAKSWT